MKKKQVENLLEESPLVQDLKYDLKKRRPDQTKFVLEMTGERVT